MLWYTIAIIHGERKRFLNLGCHILQEIIYLLILLTCSANPWNANRFRALKTSSYVPSHPAPPPTPAGPSTPSPQSFHLQQQCKCCKIPHILRETWNRDHYDIISNDITGKFSNYSASHNQLEEFATDTLL
jgi:hypothetical protein